MTSETVMDTYGARERCDQLEQLHSKEYIEVLKNMLEVPKYLVSLIVFFATATAAISRISSSAGAAQTEVFGDFERAWFLLAMIATLVALVQGFRLVGGVLDEMMLSGDNLKASRGSRFDHLRRGAYSAFVKFAMVPLLFWMISLIAIVM